ncbi:MAG: ABC transporter ATP-binding protein [Deltaproteobacteria bacterium]
MSSNPRRIALKGVWKKYSTRDAFHKSLREDIISLWSGRTDSAALREGEFWALRDVNIEVNSGECVALWGANGSGKTTILKLLAQVTYPTAGEVSVGGRIAPLIAVGAGFHPDLTGRENIFMNGTIIGMSVSEIKSQMHSIIEFSEIAPRFLDMPVKKYSSGMYVKLGFSIAVHSSADILLIDEILAVGDEGFQQKCIEKVKKLKAAGKTMIVVSHNRRQLDEIADRFIFIRQGEIRESAL